MKDEEQCFQKTNGVIYRKKHLKLEYSNKNKKHAEMESKRLKKAYMHSRTYQANKHSRTYQAYKHSRTYQAKTGFSPQACSGNDLLHKLLH